MTRRHPNAAKPLSRREALCTMGGGFGMLSFASLAGSIAKAATTNGPAPLADRQTRFQAESQARYFSFYERRPVSGRQF